MLTQEDFDAEIQAQNKRQAEPGLYKIHAPNKQWLAVEVWYNDGERDEDNNLISDEYLVAAIWRDGARRPRSS